VDEISQSLEACIINKGDKLISNIFAGVVHSSSTILVKEEEKKGGKAGA